MTYILDLTKPIDKSLEIYAEPGYSDPAFTCVEWCSVEKQGYAVQALTLGTQTGTHIDAPAHFNSAGNCLETLALDSLMGSYYLIDLSRNANEDMVRTLCESYNEETMLFVRSDPTGTSSISRSALDVLTSLGPLVWVVDGHIEVKGGSQLEFHRVLALAGKYLIENLHSEIARQVLPGGELLALPLALTGTSGAPCRVIVRLPTG